MGDETLLSPPIKELVARLISHLQEEAQRIIDEDKSHYENQLNELSDHSAQDNTGTRIEA